MTSLHAGLDVISTPEMIRAAREALDRVSGVTAQGRQDALMRIADALRSGTSEIMVANARDLTTATGNAAFIDRLTLTPERIQDMADGVARVAEMADPVGNVLQEWTRPNGLKIRQVSVPIGVIGMIYESRPNVGIDAGALCLKSGNAVILRGGSESFHSAQCLTAIVHQALFAAGMPKALVQTMPDKDRSRVGDMLSAQGGIDVIVPRGGKSLVSRVMAEARVPVLAHAEGLCHTYVDGAADLEMARKVVVNAKMRRPGICGATETLLIDRRNAAHVLPILTGDLRAAGCDCLGDAAAREHMPDLGTALESDFETEWLDARINIAIVDGVAGAIAHISRYGSGHTEAIITHDRAVAEQFMRSVNSAVVMWNASTQFCDGGQFGFGGEIGISTGRLHARGPIGAAQLTTYRYEVIGDGQTRP